MRRTDSTPRCLFRLRIGQTTIPILPLQSLKYLSIAIGLTAGGAWALSNVLLPAAASMGALATADWVSDNATINENNYKKNLANYDNWIWRSKGIPEPGPKQPGMKRILVIGDSYVWGDGSANANDIWWRQLDRELKRRGFNDVEVIGAGLCGRSTHQELDAARILVPQLDPDLVIWGYVSNDPDEQIVKLITDPLEQEEEKNDNPLNELAGQLNKLRTQKEQEESSDPNIAFTYNEWLGKIVEGENFEQYKQTVSDLSTFIDEIEVPSFFLTLPNCPMSSIADRFAYVSPVFEQNGVEWVDTLPAFLETYPENTGLPFSNMLGWGINPANGHPGSVTTQFYATQAADYIESNYPDTLGANFGQPAPTPLHVNDWMPHDLNPEAVGEGVFEFAYPESEEFMLTMPVRRPFVQLNLESPIALSHIRIESESLQSAQIDVTYADPARHFDLGEVHEYAAQAGLKLKWDVPAEQPALLVNTIRITAHFKDDAADHRLRISLIESR